MRKIKVDGKKDYEYEKEKRDQRKKEREMRNVRKNKRTTCLEFDNIDE